MISTRKQREIIDALRRGAVPGRGLDSFAVGMDRFAEAMDRDLDLVAGGGGVFKAARGEYGCGKTFFARWLQERAMGRGFAAAEVQISESDTPLHRLETVYRRMMERLTVSGCRTGALRVIIDSWFYTLEEDILAGADVDEGDERALTERTEALMEQRLAEAARRAPALGAALRGYRRAVMANDMESAEGLISWLGGQPHVAARVKRLAGVKGDVDHFAALNFLRGLLLILKDSGHPGLILVLDEVETLQRVRGDVRDKGLNALRQLIDEIDAGRFPGLYILITGTSMFFDGPRGVQRLAPLAQRLHTDFST
ncbi:MAG: BREX system ATP-binding protein BrxD, partial [Desulfobacterales bacterium]|nr:BREX system ATP-binding protein BrxD [Desulfobacterales bacterium]